MTPEMKTTALALTLLDGWKWPQYLPTVVTEVYGEDGTRERRGIFLAYGRSLGPKGYRLVVALPPLLGEDGAQTDPANLVEVASPQCIPDLDSPATAGVLLEMLQEAVPGTWFEIEYSPDPSSNAPWVAWRYCDEEANLSGVGTTFAEAVADLALRRGRWT
jgi:hypothetical protein